MINWIQIFPLRKSYFWIFFGDQRIHKLGFHPTPVFWVISWIHIFPFYNLVCFWLCWISWVSCCWFDSPQDMWSVASGERDGSNFNFMEKLQMPRFAENFVMSADLVGWLGIDCLTVGPEKPQWLDFRYNSIQWYFPAIFSSNLAQAGDETTQYDSLRNIFSIRIGYFRIWVCLKMGYIPNYSHLVGIMIINHWV